VSNQQIGCITLSLRLPDSNKAITVTMGMGSLSEGGVALENL